MRKFSATILFYLACITLLNTAVLFLRAQTPQGLSGKKISFPHMEGSQLKALFTGETAKHLTGSQIQISGFEMKTFRNGNTNDVELVVQAPECLMDQSTSVASSPGRLRAYTGTTNLVIEGEGFFCQQTNGLLIISNKVETTILKNPPKSKSDKKASGQIAPAVDTTNQFLKIYSDHFRFLYESNLVTYTGNVRVDDEQMELTCDALNIYLTNNKAIERIVADSRVVILHKKDNSRATGDRATYVVNTNQEFVELTGNPIWRDAEHEGRAGLFVFDRRSNIFRAEQNAVFTLPSEKIGQPQLLNLNEPPSTNIQSGKRVTISSDLMTFNLPETNGPVREIVADGNVIISNESDQSRATGDKAVYNEATGLVELTGKPLWKNDQGEISADVLSVGKTNRFFSARKNVAMKLPAAPLFKENPGSKSTNAPAATSQFVEIFCDDFSFATNVARFDKNVRASLLDENGSRTTLRCDFARAFFNLSNQVEMIRADRNVVLQQVPGVAHQTNILKKIISCDSLTIKRSPETELFESIQAETNVVAEQVERTKLGEITKRISADVVDVNFSTTTNQIENAVAERNVLVEKIERIGETNETVRASGERAFYRIAGEWETVELTGNPLAWTDKMLFSDAIVMLMNVKSGRITAKPYKITPLDSTTDLKSLLKSSQP